MLKLLAQDLWVVARPLRCLGIEMGTRMTVIRLQSGQLVIHSPVALDAELKAAVDALGAVAAIVAPTLFHHLYVGAWAAAYPQASLLGCPGMANKRRDLRWTRELGDKPDPSFEGEIEQVYFGACRLVHEVVLFHLASQSIVSSDFMINLSKHPSALTRAAAWALDNPAPGPTRFERALIADHAAARKQVDRMIEWGAERLVLAHGDVVESGATSWIQKGYRWLEG